MPETRVLINLSNRHIHVSKEDLEALFGAGHPLTKTKDLMQPGQFACDETVTIMGPKGKFEGVRILGPDAHRDPVRDPRQRPVQARRAGLPHHANPASSRAPSPWRSSAPPAASRRRAASSSPSATSTSTPSRAQALRRHGQGDSSALRMPGRARRRLRERRLPGQPELRPRVPPRLRRGQRRRHRQRQLRGDRQEMSKVVLKAQDLDGYLTESDKASLERMDAQYRQAMVSFNILSTAGTEGERRKEEKTPHRPVQRDGLPHAGDLHGREGHTGLLLRHARRRATARRAASSPSCATCAPGSQEFVYYIQRAYELLFNLAFGSSSARDAAARSRAQEPPHHQDAR